MVGLSLLGLEPAPALYARRTPDLHPEVARVDRVRPLCQHGKRHEREVRQSLEPHGPRPPGEHHRLGAHPG